MVWLAVATVAARERLETLQRINQFKLYELASVLHPLVELEDDAGPVKLLRRLFDARERLDEYLSPDPPVRLTVSQGHAEELRERINDLIQVRFTDGKTGRLKMPRSDAEPLASSDLLPIRKATENFEAVLRAEMEASAAFAVSKRAIYDTNDLVNAASRALPADLKAFMPDKARDEVTNAGRCLAFGLYSSSGFHICRAVEALMEAYYQVFSGKTATLKSWSDYTSEFTKLASSGKAPSPAKQTVTYLDQLRQSSRNPIMHPRVSLDESDAITLFNLGIGIMCRMAQDIRDSGVTALPTPLISSIAPQIASNTPPAITVSNPHRSP